MRLKSLLVLTILSTALVGCSNKATTVTFSGGVINYNGAPISTDKFTAEGFSAKIGDDNYEGGYTEAITLTNAAGNDQNIDEGKMDTFKGNKYFSMYLDTVVTMYKSLGKDRYAWVSVGTEKTPKDAMVQSAYNILESIPKSDKEFEKVLVEDKFYVHGVEGLPLQLFKDKVSIKGLLQLTYGEDPNCTTEEPIEFGKKIVNMKTYASSNYKYYSYAGYTIKTTIGVTLSDYIEIK